MDPSLKHLTTSQLLQSTQFRALLANRRQKGEDTQRQTGPLHKGTRPMSSKGARGSLNTSATATRNVAPEEVVPTPAPQAPSVEPMTSDPHVETVSTAGSGIIVSHSPVVRRERSPHNHSLSTSPAARARSMVNEVFEDARSDVISTSMGGKDHRRHSRYVNDIRVRTLTAVPAADDRSDRSRSRSNNHSSEDDLGLSTGAEGRFQVTLLSENEEEGLVDEVARAESDLKEIRRRKQKLLKRAQKEKEAEERRGLTKVAKQSQQGTARNLTSIHGMGTSLCLTDSAAAAAMAYSSKSNSAFLKPLPRRLPEGHQQSLNASSSKKGGADTSNKGPTTPGGPMSSTAFTAIADSDKVTMAKRLRREQLAAAAEVEALAGDLQARGPSGAMPNSALPDSVTYGQVRNAHHAARMLLRNQRPFRFTIDQLESIIPSEAQMLLASGESLKEAAERHVRDGQHEAHTGRSTTPTTYFGRPSAAPPKTSSQFNKPTVPVDTGDPLWQVLPETLSYAHHTANEDRTTALRLGYLFLEAGLMASAAKVAGANTERVIRSLRGTLTPTMAAMEGAIINGVLDPEEVAGSSGWPIYTPVTCGVVGPDQGAPCGSVIHYLIVEKSRPTAAYATADGTLSAGVYYVALHWTVPLQIFIDDRGTAMPSAAAEDEAAHDVPNLDDPPVRTIPVAPLGSTRALAHAKVVEAASLMLPIIQSALLAAAGQSMASANQQDDSPRPTATGRGDPAALPTRAARESAKMANKVRTVVMGHGAAGALSVALAALLAPQPQPRKGRGGTARASPKGTSSHITSAKGQPLVPPLALAKAQPSSSPAMISLTEKESDGTDSSDSGSSDKEGHTTPTPADLTPASVPMVPHIDLSKKEISGLEAGHTPHPHPEPLSIAICGVVALGSPQIFPSINDKRKALGRFGAYSRTQHRSPKANAAVFYHFAIPIDPIIQQPISYAGGGSGIGMGIIVPGTDFVPFATQRELEISDPKIAMHRAGLGGLFEPRLLPCHEADVNDAALDEADLIFSESQGNLSSVRSVESVDDELGMLIRRKRLHDLHLAALQVAMAKADRSARKNKLSNEALTTSRVAVEGDAVPLATPAEGNPHDDRDDEDHPRERASSVATTVTSVAAGVLDAAIGAIAADAPDFDATQTLLLPIIHSTEAECFKVSTLNAYLICLLEMAKAAVLWLGHSKQETSGATKSNMAASSAFIKLAGTLQQDYLYYPLQAPSDQPSASTLAPLGDVQWEAMPPPFRQFLSSQFMLPLKLLYSPTLLTMERLAIVFPTTAERVDATSNAPETAVDFYHATTQAALEARKAKRSGKGAETAPQKLTPPPQNLAGSGHNTSAKLRGAPTPRATNLSPRGAKVEPADPGHRFSPMLVRCLLSLLPPSPELAKALEEEVDEAEERRRMQFIAPESVSRPAGEAKSRRALERCYSINSSAIPLASLIALLRHATDKNNNAYQPSAAVKGLGGKGLGAPNATAAGDSERAKSPPIDGARPPSRQGGEVDGLVAAAIATPYGVVEGASAGASFLQLPFLSLGDLCSRLPMPPPLTIFGGLADLGPQPDPLHVPFLDSNTLLRWAWREYCCPQTGPRFIFLLLSLPEVGVAYGSARPTYSASPNDYLLDSPTRSNLSKAQEIEAPKELLAPIEPYHRYHATGCGYGGAWGHVLSGPSSALLMARAGVVDWETFGTNQATTSKPSTPPPPATTRPNYLDLFTEDGQTYTFAISSRTKLTTDVRGRVPAAAKAIDTIRTTAEKQRQAEEVKEGWREGKRMRFNPSDAAMDKEKRKKSLAIAQRGASITLSAAAAAMPPLLPPLCPIVSEDPQAARGPTTIGSSRSTSVTSLQKSPQRRLKHAAAANTAPSLSKAADLALRHIFQRHSTTAPVSPLEPREGEEGPVGAESAATTSSELPVAAPSILQFECVLALSCHTPMAGADLSLSQLDAATGVPVSDLLASALALQEAEVVASYAMAKHAVKSPSIKEKGSPSHSAFATPKQFTFSGELVEEGFLALYKRVLALADGICTVMTGKAAALVSPTLSPAEQSLAPHSLHTTQHSWQLTASSLRQTLSYHGYGEYTLVFESIPLPPLLLNGSLSAEDAATLRKASSAQSQRESSSPSSRAQSAAIRVGSGASSRSADLNSTSRTTTPPMAKRRGHSPHKSAEEAAAAEAQAYFQANRRLHRHMCLHWPFTACRCQGRLAEHKLMCRREQKALRVLMEKMVMLDAEEGVGSYTELLSNIKNRPTVYDHTHNGTQMQKPLASKGPPKAAISPKRRAFAEDILDVRLHVKAFGTLPHSLKPEPATSGSKRKLAKGADSTEPAKLQQSGAHHAAASRPEPSPTGFVASKRYQTVYGSTVPRLLNDQQRACLGMPPTVPLALRDLISRFEAEQRRAGQQAEEPHGWDSDDVIE